MVIRFEGVACQVIHARHHPEPRKGGGFVDAWLENLTTKNSWTQRFIADRDLEEVPVERKAMSFLYEDANQCWLMDTQTFEQIGIPPALIGKRRPFLREGMPLSVAFVDGQPTWVAFHELVDARIALVFPPDHYQAAYKRAILENGVEVTVPLFVEAGDAVSLHLDLLTALSPLKCKNR